MIDSVHVKYKHTKDFFRNSIEEIDREIFDLLFRVIDRANSEVSRFGKRIVELNQMRTELIERFLKVVESPTRVELVFKCDETGESV